MGEIHIIKPKNDYCNYRILGDEADPKTPSVSKKREENTF